MSGTFRVRCKGDMSVPTWLWSQRAAKMLAESQLLTNSFEMSQSREVCWTNFSSTAKLGETANKQQCSWKRNPSSSTLANLPERNVSPFAFTEKSGHQ